MNRRRIEKETREDQNKNRETIEEETRKNRVRCEKDWRKTRHRMEKETKQIREEIDKELEFGGFEPNGKSIGNRKGILLRSILS